MSGCSSGSWTKKNYLSTGSHTLHWANATGYGCPFLYLGHTDNGTFGACYTTSSGTRYANCQVRIP